VLRSITERVEDTTYREIGVPKKRLPKRRRPECKWVQLKLVEEPSFVQSISVDDFVQSSNGFVQTEKHHVQSAPDSTASFISSTPAPTSTTTEAASPSEAVVVVAELKKYGPATLETATKLIRSCRAHFTHATADEIGGMILAGAATPEITRRVGKFFLSIAEIFETWVARRKSPHTQRGYREDFMAYVRFLGIAWPRDGQELSRHLPDSR
jgi:hypothetical protein